MTPKQKDNFAIDFYIRIKKKTWNLLGYTAPGTDSDANKRVFINCDQKSMISWKPKNQRINVLRNPANFAPEVASFPPGAFFPISKLRWVSEGEL